MADLRIDSRMKVKTLKANFKKAFGATLRVYTTATCKAKADDEATLRVGNFEKKVTEMYGIGVQVANAADTKLSDNEITLAAAGKE